MYTKKLLISFFLTVTLGIITCGAIFFVLGDKLLKANINKKVQEVDSEFREVFSNQESLLTALIETIGEAPEIAQALQSQNKNLLYQKYRSLFTQLKKAHGVTHFAFHLPNRKNLIRIHLPKISGDLIDRSSLIKAAKTGLISKGLEQGTTGNITLRVVKPIFQDKEIVGFFELGTDISYILNIIRQHVSVSYTILVDKHFLESTKWRGQIEKSADQTDWDTLENFVVVGSSDRTSPQNLVKIQDSLRSDSSDYLEVSDGDFWRNYPLLDLDNEKMGLILIHGSVSDILSPLFKALTAAGLLFLTTTALLFYASCKICRNFIKSNQAAKHSAQMSSVGEMASGITHEIANPVTVIAMCAAHLKTLIDADPQDKNKIYEMIDRVERMTSRITKINTSMRLASRHGDHDPASPTSIKTLISETLEICVSRLRNENIELRLHEIPDHTIHCRSFQISQVLLNLLNNARDAVSHLNEKWIELKVELTKDGLRILVTDSGKGIPKKVVDKMMSPFFTTKEVHKGTGLGLSISQEIIREHQGKLYYDPSYPNTRFVIEIPIPDSFAAHI